MSSPRPAGARAGTSPRWLPGAALTACLLATPAADAALLAFEPDAGAATVGDPVVVGVVVTGLGGAIVAGYDISVGFDPALLSLAATGFGPFLDGPGGSIQSPPDLAAANASGIASVAEVNFTFDPAGQDGFSDFTLFTLTFEAVGAGLADLSFAGNILGEAAPDNFLFDSFFFPIAVDNVEGAPAARVSVAAAAVPEPVTVLLLAAGLLALVRTRAGARG